MRARHRRGEQHGLAGVRGGVEQGLDVLDEAHVEHLVGLVEHDDLEVVQPQRAAVHQVDRPARRGDDDVDALGQPAQLRADGGAAVDGEHAGAHASAVAGDRLGDLQRQLPGGGQDETERGGAAGALGRCSPRRSSIGSANAAVLPVPVAAWPIRSRPSTSGAIASVWIGVGVV